VFVTADGGEDLEHFAVRDFDEARSILLQTTVALAVAEEACRFEHRDLHWGNVLISRPDALKSELEAEAAELSTHRLRGVDLHVQKTAGVKVAIIDFTLSRLDLANGGVAFCNLAADPELFEGPKGDCQMETYRRMRKQTGDNWEEHHSKTNAMWVHYLADTMLTKKQVPFTASGKRALQQFRRRALQ